MTQQTWWLSGLIATCLLLLTCAVAINSDMSRSYQLDQEANRKTCALEFKADSSRRSKECQSILYRTIDDPVALLTGALTVATAALFIVTFGLYLAAARQGSDAKELLRAAQSSAEAAKQAAEAAQSANKLSMETFFIDQRPKVIFEDETFLRSVGFDPIRAAFLLRVAVLNVGKGTAIKVHIVSRLAFGFPDGSGVQGFRDNLVEAIKGEDKLTPGLVIYGGMDAYIDVHLRIDVEEIKALQAESNTLSLNPYLAIVVVYETDIAGRGNRFHSSVLCRLTRADKVSAITWDANQPDRFTPGTLSFQRIRVPDSTS